MVELPKKLLKKLVNELVKRYNRFNPTLLQLHHQSKTDYTTEMISQNEIWCEAQMQEWWKEVAKDHPLPEGYQWMVCTFDSIHFVKTTEEAILKANNNKETK